MTKPSQKSPGSSRARGFAVAFGALILLGLAGPGAVYIASERHLHDAPERRPFTIDVPEDAASIEQGRYIARTRGCFGCHGQQLQGEDFSEQWDWPARAVAPNLARYAREHEPVIIAAAIRQGIGASGKGLVSMPSYNFTRLSDADTAALIAFLRSAPVVEADLPRPELGWIARFDLALGREQSYAHWAERVPELRFNSESDSDSDSDSDADTDSERARGEYLAMTMCNECHGLDLRGYNFNGDLAPDLAIVGAIEREEFERIVRTGRGLGERHLGLMSLVAPDRYPLLTGKDIDALYLHLSALLGEPIPQNVYWREQGQ